MCASDKNTHLNPMPSSIPPTGPEFEKQNTNTAVPIPSGSTKNVTARRVGGDSVISSRNCRGYEYLTTGAFTSEVRSVLKRGVSAHRV